MRQHESQNRRFEDTPDAFRATYRFSLRTLFILVTLAAVACLLIRAAFHVPILAVVCMFYVPLFALYALLRGPLLISRWRALKHQYDEVVVKRRSYLPSTSDDDDNDNDSGALTNQSSK